ncbi:CDP-alcohol phosphatidyltransferase-domain-containing protein [Cokeromyces recurvatus]|uniref:CDP-alcohol phosphatidyltransferase-domain-containing protein n=1 Tax=Cokeromyces recurvatus TaxID=90255 RepID=UPI00221FF48B|nr:CDP-alcohol phosphatidyltransferase-domain-containing protein [Cokeromyces recurvatus]KAI7906091.1 CDP-alcohol phosphatidyltransferase-domain-containing protein [Cokeromyces recurvatus]
MFGSSTVLKAEFLTREQLSALHLYKYRAIDKSFVSRYVLSHYWNWCVQFFPINMAPNLITLTGLLFMVLNVILAILFVPDMGNEDVSEIRWIYFSFAIGLWLYSTFDNVDGKQARRTGTSSPLGELFDHGCDAINCSFAAILQATAVGLGHSKASVLLYSIAMLGFYLSTVEEYHTGTLYLGYINGPTEGVLLSCFIFILSGVYGKSSKRIERIYIYMRVCVYVCVCACSFITTSLYTYISGPGIWKVPMKEAVKVAWLPKMIQDIPVSHAVIWWIGCLFLFTHAPTCFYAMYKACKQRQQPFLRTMLVQNMPIATYIICFYAWIMSPYSTILTHQHFILFAITTGIVFGRMATKVILAHLTKSKFPKFTVLLIPLMIGAILTNIPILFPVIIGPIFTPKSEYAFLLAYFGFAVIAYMRWAIVVINSFCEFLGIQCLIIPPIKKVE